ncbi:TonB-dependent receptor [Congregibacter litoralis]|uniref:Outer membrane receptor protein, mostly Fe transport n=1 Tax=Congregibacter litoralis KT71 TaxID=314285 RepID=A4ADY0_9GAMM|nr:TonB-dependent receptor [Congregibacter litoralis]EAQ95790.2 Outer membrane receptor protein, mostly Fe transport [Congregibacter litoralis KT71]
MNRRHLTEESTGRTSRISPFHRPNILALATISALTCLSERAHAQNRLEEIVVTASRRDSTIQDTPYNISALSGDQITRSGVNDFGDLLRLVPGAAFLDQGARVGGNNPNIILRGINANAMIGSFDFPNVAVAPVSVYLNETPVFFPIMLKDLERVEVLRGPQGTLYGSGSVGGTLKLLTRRPETDQFTAEIRGGAYGTSSSDEGSYEASTTINAPLGDNLALRVNLATESVGGFIDAANRYRLDDSGAAVPADPSDPVNSLPVVDTVEDISDTSTDSARFALRYQPTDKIDAVISYIYQRDESDGRQIQNPFVGSRKDYVEYHATPEPYSRDVDLVSLEVDVDFGFATMTSATSYYENESDQSVDYSDFWVATTEAYYYSAFPRVISPERSITNDTGFIQELRIRSNSDGKFDWLIGGFYSDIESDVLSLYTLPGAAAWNELPRAAGDPPPYAFANNVDLNTLFDRSLTIQDIAIFGELTYHITDNWQVTVGARAFETDFEQDLVEALPHCGYYCASDGVDPNGSIFLNVNESESDQVFKANTSYNFSDNLMIYGTVVEGYRRGGANIALLNHPFFPDPPELLTFKPDLADNYEVGVKGIVNEAIQYTVAAFYIDWQDPQIDSFTPFGNPAVVNAEGARTQGLEVEMSGRLSDSLRFNLGYSYTSAELTEDFDAPDGSQGKSGDALPGVPEHTASVALDYVHSLASDSLSDVSFHLNGYYRSATDSSFEGIRFFPIDAFSIWNASATFNSKDQRWALTAFVDNISNELGITGGIPETRNGPIGQFYFVTRPRSFGLRATYRFE